MTTLMQFSGLSLVHALGWTLLHFFWQGAVIAVLLWCVLGLLGAASPTLRYLVACVALVLTVLLPLATFAYILSAQNAMRAHGAIAIDAGMVLRVGSDGPAAPWQTQIAETLDRAAPWIMLTWFAGVLFFLGRLNAGFLIARRMRFVATETPPPDLQEMFDELCHRLEISRPVRLLKSALVEVPTVIGWLRPVVLVPLSCFTGLSSAQVEAILSHELAHIRRHDYLVSVVQSVIEALLFYHPAVWWVSKQVRRERECCCDDMAVGVGGDALAYAKALSYLEERRSSLPEVALGANGGVLTMRIKRLLGCTERSAASQFAAMMVLTIVIAGAGAWIGTTARAEVKAAVHQVPAMLSAALEPPTGTAQVNVSAGAVGAMKVSAVEMMKNVYISASPSYPMIAKAAHVEGDVSMNVAISKGGSVKSAQVVSGPEMLRTSALQAAESMSFHPYLVNGVPVEAHTTLTFHYSILRPPASLGPGAAQLTITDGDGVTTKAEPIAMALAVPPSPPDDAPTVVGGAPAPTGALKVSGGVMQGALTFKVDPVYPPIARAAHVQGAVVLRAIVSKTGTIQNLQAVSGPQMLQGSAMDAVRQWTYKPYLLNGQPTEVETTITVNFSFEGAAATPGETIQIEDAGVAPKRIGGSVSPPVVIYQVDPEYSEQARAAKFNGIVVVNLVVNSQGNVSNVRVLRGVGMGLDEKAVEAVRQYKFRPAMEDGKPVPVELNIEINFKIGDQPKAQTQPIDRSRMSSVRKVENGGSV